MQSLVQHSTKTSKTSHRDSVGGRKASRLPSWKPQATGLTRDELRAIVLEQLG